MQRNRPLGIVLMSSASCYFKPWQGSRYHRGYEKGKRLLLLGESHYDEGGRAHPGRNFTIQVVEALGLARERKHPYWTKLVQIVTGDDAHDIDRDDFWSRVAFYNFIQECVGDGPRIRPTDEHWKEAEAPFFSVLEELRPHYILVLGKELWNRMPEPKGTSEEGDRFRAGRRKHESWWYRTGPRSWALAAHVNHPSSPGFSAKEAHKVAAALLE